MKDKKRFFIGFSKFDEKTKGAIAVSADKNNRSFAAEVYTALRQIYSTTKPSAPRNERGNNKAVKR